MRTAVGLLMVALLPALAGCSPSAAPADPPSVAASSPSPVASLALPASPLPSRLPRRPPTATASPSSSGFPASVLVPCNGRPTGEQVIALVRARRSLLPAGARVGVKAAPMCASTWQYTVLDIVGSEPMQVVTRGQAASIAFVTAGTDVCTVEVRAAAPPALLTAANC